MTGTQRRFGALAWLTAALVVGSTAGFAAETTWIRSFEGLNYGAFFDVVATDEGDLLAVGTTYHPLVPTTRGDILISKLTAAGDVLWERTYGGSATDQGFRIVHTEDGGSLVLAETDSLGAGERDLYLLRLDPNGDEVWAVTYGGSGTEWAKDLIALSNDEFLIVAETNSHGDDFDAYVLRVRTDGTVVWEMTLGDAEQHETGVAALETDSGDLLVLVGVTHPGSTDGSRRDARLYRLDSEGREIWNVLYHAERKQWPNDMIFTSSGDVVIAGISEPVIGVQGPLDFWLAKADAESGELLWTTREGSQYKDDYGVAVAAIDDDSYLVAGFGPGFPFLRLRDDGTSEWLREAVPDRAWVIYAGFSMLRLPDGSFVVPGWVYVRRTGDDFDAVLARIDAEASIAK